jgi:hypothetical protein
MTKLSPKFRGLILALLAGFSILGAMSDAAAQIKVDLALPRSLFIRYEPVVATVTITNLTGGNLQLADVENHKWFSFHIENADGQLVPPYNVDYNLDPVEIPSGASIKRSVDITPLYPISEFGTYRIRATVYDQTTGQYFSSVPPLNIEVTEGQLLWQQTVGVPDGAGDGKSRTVSLLSFRLPETEDLYLRIEDKDSGIIYCTHQLGRTLSFSKPLVQLDQQNQVHVLQGIAPRQFIYTHVDLNGKVLERKEYDGSETSRPVLARNTDGSIAVRGGLYVDAEAVAKAAASATPPPGVGDRPMPVPKD